MPGRFLYSRHIVLLFVFTLLAVPVAAQSTAFTYQGKLTDSGNLANGNYDLQFKLFDAVSGGAQQGTTQTLSNVSVSNGIFTVQLDFGVCASCFNGSARFLEIAVKPTSGGSFTTLSPRQPITSTPYAINSAQLGGLAASGFLQNSTSQQASSNFNISGDGTAGGTLSGSIVNAVTQFNLNGLRVFTVNGPHNAGGYVFTASNTFAGDSAGLNTMPDPSLTGLNGKLNSFVGAGAGQANTTGGGNAFFGFGAGLANTTGNNNAFFGLLAGRSNTTANFNAFFGYQAGFTNTIGQDNAFFGASAGQFNTTGNNNAFFGTNAGVSNTGGNDNAFFGTSAGQQNTTNGNQNSFFGSQAGQQNTTGFSNSFFGAQAGQQNTTGVSNAFFGVQAGTSNTTGNSNAFFGTGAGLSNSTGGTNAFFGAQAGFFNTTGSSNNFFGFQSGYSNSTGVQNSFFGYQSGQANTTGGGNAFFGTQAGQANIIGIQNSFFGTQAGQSNMGSNNSFFGYQAGNATTNGFNNAFFGSGAGQANNTNFNAFFGSQAGNATTTGSVNAFFGGQAGQLNTTGHDNVFIGSSAGMLNTTGFRNTFIGNFADFNSSTPPGNNNTLLGVSTSIDSGAFGVSNGTAIGANAMVTQSNTLILGGINGINNGTSVNVGIGTTTPAYRLHVVDPGNAGLRVQTSGSPGQVASFGPTGTFDIDKPGIVGGRFTVKENGDIGIGMPVNGVPAAKLQVIGDIRVGTSGANGCLQSFNGSAIAGTCSSDARFKRDITPFPNLLSKIAHLRPVYFYWRSEQFPERHFGQAQEAGLIAQEVEKVLPELVSEDAQGYKAVNYSKLPLLTLQAVKELKAENDTLKQKLHEQQQQLTRQQQELAALKARQQQEIEELKKLVSAFHPKAKRRKY